MMRKLFSFILSFLFCLSLGGQDVTVKAQLDSANIYLGDQVDYSVTITQPADIRLSIPAYSDTLYRGLEIVSQSEIDTAYSDSGKITLRKSFTITSFDTGYYQIPPFYAEYQTPQGKKAFYSDYVPLRVNRVDIAPPDSSEVIFDIVGPEKVGYGAGEILPWVFLVLVAIVAGWLLYKYLPRKEKKEEEKGPPMPDEPVHIIVLRELDKLEKKGLWQAGKIKEFYSELTDILRYYLEMRYAIPAPEMTSWEIIKSLGKSKIEDDQVLRLKNILKNADLSKFARYKHTAQINSSAIPDGREFVKATYRREETVADKAEEFKEAGIADKAEEVKEAGMADKSEEVKEAGIAEKTGRVDNAGETKAGKEAADE